MAHVIQSYTQTTCMVCGSVGENKYKNLKDRHFGDTEGWDLSRCSNKSCDLYWLDPMPTKEDIWKAYDSYYTHSDNRKTFLDFAWLEAPYLALKYNHFPEMGMKKYMGLLAYLLPVARNKFDYGVLYLHKIQEGKILDFGCGNGTFLDNMMQGGWQAYGLDFDIKAVNHCKSKGINANTGDIPSQNYPDNFFDVITINHVIEHVHEVDTLLADCFKVLKKGGKLVIATPNTESWQHSIYHEHWLQLDPPRHLHIFNIDNLETVVKRNSFTIVKSFSSSRIDAWSAIVSRAVRRKGYFGIGSEKKTIGDLISGLFQQRVSHGLSVINKKLGGEIILTATK
jgi:2-polyprenyl-3-methyl-5-hydroxy-6-metoxy-1,4-benzoquinol methylase